MDMDWAKRLGSRPNSVFNQSTCWRAQRPALVLGADRLRAVLDEVDPRIPGDLGERVVVRRCPP